MWLAVIVIPPFLVGAATCALFVHVQRRHAIPRARVLHRARARLA
ncbi:MAG: hypothetical protein ACTHU0_09535 [Kofleriaceae bacterium]